MSSLITAENAWALALTNLRQWRPTTVDGVSLAAAPYLATLRHLRAMQRVSMLLLLAALLPQIKAIARFANGTPIVPDFLMAAGLILVLLIPKWRAVMGDSLRGAFRSEATLVTQARIQAGPAPLSPYDIQAVNVLVARVPELRAVWESWQTPTTCLGHREALQILAAGEAWERLEAARAAAQSAEALLRTPPR